MHGEPMDRTLSLRFPIRNASQLTDMRVEWLDCRCPRVLALNDGVVVGRLEHAHLEVGRNGLEWVEGTMPS